MPPTQIGPYHLVRLLAQGGMGAVYEAVQQPIERRVALKILKPELATDEAALTRFFNEARVVNQIEHPSLVQVSDFGQTPDGIAYLVMEYLRGEPLSVRITAASSAGQRLPLTESLQLAVQAAAGLAAAHSKGIIHRDLKPANVMLVPDPAVPCGERVKILDFGIAKLMQSQGTAANELMGTPAYMSPEQCQGAGHVDERTDVYALGVMLYEMLSGRTPFIGEGCGDFIAQHILREPPALAEVAPHVPLAVAALVHRMLTKDRTQRPSMQEAGELLARLALISSSVPAFPLSGSSASQKSRLDPSVVLPALPASSQTTLSQSLGHAEFSLADHRDRRPTAMRTTAAIAAVLLLLALVVGSLNGRRHRLAASTARVRPDGPVLAHGANPGERPKQNPTAVAAPLLLPPQADQSLPPTAAQDVAPAEETMPPAPRKVRWQIRTIPDGATVFQASGTPLGVTPLDYNQIASPGRQIVTLRRQGFVEQRVALEASRNQLRTIHLMPKPARQSTRKVLSNDSIQLIN